MAWVVAPLPVADLHASMAAGRPVCVRRPGNPGYYGHLYGRRAIKAWLASGDCRYTYNVDVVRYDGAARSTFNTNSLGPKDVPGCDPGAPAQLEAVWRRFKRRGCSVRVLHPQQREDRLWRLMARLENELTCCVGWSVCSARWRGVAWRARRRGCMPGPLSALEDGALVAGRGFPCACRSLCVGMANPLVPPTLPQPMQQCVPDTAGVAGFCSTLRRHRRVHHAAGGSQGLEGVRRPRQPAAPVSEQRGRGDRNWVAGSAMAGGSLWQRASM